VSPPKASVNDPRLGRRRPFQPAAVAWRWLLARGNARQPSTTLAWRGNVSTWNALAITLTLRECGAAARQECYPEKQKCLHWLGSTGAVAKTAAPALCSRTACISWIRERVGTLHNTHSAESEHRLGERTHSQRCAKGPAKKRVLPGTLPTVRIKGDTDTVAGYKAAGLLRYR
jgi:hypothetical protein